MQLIRFGKYFREILDWPRGAFRWLFPAILLIFVSVMAQPESYNHPELEWQTIETEHFRVNYHQGTVRTANLVAQIAEEVYPHIIGLYQYEPDGKIEFIIRDTDDYSNGGAYFFDNKIEIWAENMDYILRGTHNWLRDVVTHEFTHMISLQKALRFGRTIPAGWFQVFGYEKEKRPDVVRGFPNVLVSYPISGVTIPVWFAEGVAQYQSPSMRFDYRDSHREMILRDRVVTGRLLDLKEMNTFGKNSIGNESSYNQGFAFVNYLTERFGPEILPELSELASSPFRFTFESALKKATGIPAGQLYQQWKRSLEENYHRKLQTIRQHIVKGDPVETTGIGNIFPTASPDGRKVAYLTTGKNDYLSMNALIVLERNSGKKRAIAGRVSSSLSWSPDGRYLVYSKQTNLQPNGSSFNDIYIYDLQNNKEYQITRALRARNPDWSHDGKRLAFVVGSDGITNLFVLQWERLEDVLKAKKWETAYYDLDRHKLVFELPDSVRSDWQKHYRKIHWRGGTLRQLTFLMDGRQIYHPRWSLDDTYLVFDTSVGFGRDIARISAEGGDISFLLDSPCDERYPVFHPVTGELFFAADYTGIFNIYSMGPDSNEKLPHTNVIGGALMPSVTAENDLFYALYENQGYKIYSISRVNALPAEYLEYESNYDRKIPRLMVNDQLKNPLPATPYTRHFTGIAFMPRLLIDYGTIKPGFYLYTGDVLDKVFFLGGFDINRQKDINIFALFEWRAWKHTFFIEFYNQTAKITDRFQIEGYPDRIERDVHFNLIEGDVGFYGKYKNILDWRLTYIVSLYKAKSDLFTFVDRAANQTYVSPPFRYTYLRGQSISLLLKHDGVLPAVDRDINPRKGRYVTFKYQYERNRFLTGFDPNKVIASEIYEPYNFNRFELNWEEYLPVPFTHHHSLTLRLQGGLIDRPVDDFFHFFGGGLVGLKGYPFYSVEGRRLAIGSLFYRFPLVRHLNWQIFNMYLDKIYLAGFYQTGKGWSEGLPRAKDFLSDAGVQLRLDTFSWYLFPLRIFFEAAYPLQQHVNQGIVYKQEWKFYFGILFDFDLRLESQKLRVR